MSFAEHRQKVTDRIIAEASSNPEFRASLIADPKAAMEGFLGITIPAGMTVTVMEESVSNVVVVLPFDHMADLSEDDLALVAGGTTYVNGVNQDSY